MPPKAERIELRLEAETVDAVDRWRADQADVPSRSEAMRRLIDRGLIQQPRGSFRMSKGEALTNWMLAELLKQQEGSEGRELGERVQDVILGGHYWALDWEQVGIMHGYADRYSDVQFVSNVMDMWSFIERAYKGLSPSEKKKLEDTIGFRGRDPRFTGFDGNNETELMAIACFLVEKLRRFTAFADRDFNSHLPRTEIYRAMFEKFEPIRANLIGREMSVEELIGVLSLDG